MFQVNDTLKQVFKATPFVTYRNPKTIGRKVVRAKVPPLVTRKGTFKCGWKMCQVCNNLIETAEFRSSQTGKVYKINYELNCNSKGIIYLMTCKVCTEQLMGECTMEWHEGCQGTNCRNITTLGTLGWVGPSLQNTWY